MHHIHRKKLIDRFSGASNSLLFLQGGIVQYSYDTDREIDFKQESNFYYLTGIEDPDFSLLMDVDTEEFILIIPRRDASYATWYGAVYPPSFYIEEFDADKVIYSDELESWLKNRRPKTIFCYNEAQQAVARTWGFPTDNAALKASLIDCRVIKTSDELDMLRHASWVASEAHIATAQCIEAGINESELRAIYLYHTMIAGQRHEPYVGIHGGGVNSAILHYIKNNLPLESGKMYLIDAGAETAGYVADITRTYPVDGIFKPTQKALYDIVLNMQLGAIEMARAGVKMEDLHLKACDILLDGLRDMDLIRGANDVLLEKNVFALFFPHGLGHFLGLDTHDVGGYPKGVERIDRPGLKYLRVRRTLEPNMVITIEPGIYFIPAILKPAFENPDLKPFLNVSKIESLMSFGGIRIEDNIIITETGHENMTHVPKTADDVEAMMAG